LQGEDEPLEGADRGEVGGDGGHGEILRELRASYWRDKRRSTTCFAGRKRVNIHDAPGAVISAHGPNA
jgi:hypothetical protein